jgi:hypothetical protein
MSLSARAVVPFNKASMELSELPDEVRVGAEKIFTNNGNSNVALIDAGRLGCHHLEFERIHLRLIDDATLGFDEIIAGKTHQADSAMAEIHKCHMVRSTVIDTIRQQCSVNIKLGRQHYNGDD